MKKLIKGYIKANKKIGFLHRDVKLNNIIINPKKKIIKLIDYGLASSNDVSGPQGSLKIVYNVGRYVGLLRHVQKKRRLAPNIKLKEMFKKDPLDLLSFQNFDLEALLRLIGSGERILFNDKKPFIINIKDVEYLNQNIPFYKKLEYILRKPYFH